MSVDRTIFRVASRHKPYAQLGNAMLRDKGMSLEARGTLAFILSFPPNWEFTLGWFCRDQGIGRDRARRIIKEQVEVFPARPYALGQHRIGHRATRQVSAVQHPERGVGHKPQGRRSGDGAAGRVGQDAPCATIARGPRSGEVRPVRTLPTSLASPLTIKGFELVGVDSKISTLNKLRRALENAGVEFIVNEQEANRGRLGVRLREEAKR